MYGPLPYSIPCYAMTPNLAYCALYFKPELREFFKKDILNQDHSFEEKVSKDLRKAIIWALQLEQKLLANFPQEELLALSGNRGG